MLRVRAAGERDLVLLPCFPSHGWVRANLNVRAAGERDRALPIDGKWNKKKCNGLKKSNGRQAGLFTVLEEQSDREGEREGEGMGDVGEEEGEREREREREVY